MNEDFLKIVKDAEDEQCAAIVEPLDVAFINDMSHAEIGKEMLDKHGKITTGMWLRHHNYYYPFGATLDEMDVEAYFNMRTWVEDAVAKHGGEVTGGGIGMGAADIDVMIEGAPYNITIRPRPIYK